MEFRPAEVVALLLLSYTIFVFISDSIYLYRSDYYARRSSPYEKRKKRLGSWCALSLLIAGLLVSVFHGSLQEPASLIIALVAATCLMAPAAARHAFSQG